MNRRGFAAIVIILFVVIILAVVIGIWYYKTDYESLKAGNSLQASNSNSSWTAYTYAEYGFSLKYPSQDCLSSSTDFEGSPAILEIEENPCPFVDNQHGDISIMYKVDVLATDETLESYLTNPANGYYSTGTIITALPYPNITAYKLDQTASFDSVDANSDAAISFFVLNPKTRELFMFQGPTQDPVLVETFLPTFEFTSSTADASDWKMYHSNEFGIEIKYPGDWFGASEVGPTYIGLTSEPPEDATQTKPGALNGYKVEIYTGTYVPFDNFLPATETLPEWEAANISDDGLTQILSTSTITVDGKTAFRTITNIGENVDMVVPPKNAIVSIVFYGHPDNNVFEQMLSTFKIL